MRRHVERLRSREYALHLPEAAAFVVLFLPNDGVFSAAAERDPELLELALARGVVLATPSTLYALLHAVAQGWREERLAENAHRISALGRELCERLATFAEHLGRAGASLGRSVEHYNAAVASFDARLLPSARRLLELGAESRKELSEPEPFDVRPRVRGCP